MFDNYSFEEQLICLFVKPVGIYISPIFSYLERHRNIKLSSLHHHRIILSEKNNNKVRRAESLLTFLLEKPECTLSEWNPTISENINIIVEYFANTLDNNKITYASFCAGEFSLMPFLSDHFYHKFSDFTAEDLSQEKYYMSSIFDTKESYDFYDENRYIKHSITKNVNSVYKKISDFGIDRIKIPDKEKSFSNDFERILYSYLMKRALDDPIPYQYSPLSNLTFSNVISVISNNHLSNYKQFIFHLFADARVNFWDMLNCYQYLNDHVDHNLFSADYAKKIIENYLQFNETMPISWWIQLLPELIEDEHNSDDQV